MSDRERRRLRVNQLQQAVTTKRNAASETNKTYLKLRKDLNDDIEDRIAGGAVEEEAESPSKKIDDGVKESTLALKDDETDTHGKQGKTEDAEESEEEVGDHEPDPIPAWPCQPPFFIQENGTFRKYWEIIIIFLALYNATLIPL